MKWQRTVVAYAALILLVPLAMERHLTGQQPRSEQKKSEPARLNRTQSQLFYKGYSIPDPNDLLSVVPFAVNPSVAQEIGLQPEPRKLLKALLLESNGTPGSVRVTYTGDPSGAPSPAELNARFATILRERRALADELLSPEMQKRLREIAYQIEVSRVGLGTALTQGKLGEDVGVFENQKTALSEKAERTELKMRERISQAMKEAQDELLEELTPEQRTKAKDCLGKPFYYRSDDYRLQDSKRFEE